jgi:hypothetical protein
MARCLLLAILAVTLSGGTTEAYQLLGPGGASCGTWTADRRTGLHQIDLAWVLGFLTAVGYIGVDNLDPLQGLDANAVAAWIDSYCQQHPLQDIDAAAQAFLHAHPH